MQLAPACRPVGAFTIRGHAGSNHLPFHRRLRGRLLPPGTYRVTGRTHGRQVVRATVVVAAVRPTAQALGVGTCGAAASLLRSALGAPVAVRGPLLPSTKTLAGSLSAPAEAAVVPHSGVLGAGFTNGGPRVDAARALLLADALFAIVLLGLAALPARALTNPRLSTLVETRRMELALAGGATLGVALVAAFVTGS